MPHTPSPIPLKNGEQIDAAILEKVETAFLRLGMELGESDADEFQRVLAKLEEGAKGRHPMWNSFLKLPTVRLLQEVGLVDEHLGLPVALWSAVKAAIVQEPTTHRFQVVSLYKQVRVEKWESQRGAETSDGSPTTEIKEPDVYRLLSIPRKSGRDDGEIDTGGIGY